MGTITLLVSVVLYVCVCIMYIFGFSQYPTLVSPLAAYVLLSSLAVVETKQTFLKTHCLTMKIINLQTLMCNCFYGVLKYRDNVSLYFIVTPFHVDAFVFLLMYAF
jgi:hypothetical protein